jgi:hypothetical protein
MLARVLSDEPGQHLEHGGLAATRRPDEGDEFTFGEFEGNVFNHLYASVITVIGLRDVIEDDAFACFLALGVPLHRLLPRQEMRSRIAQDLIH